MALFRSLRKEEVEVKVSRMLGSKGFALLIYKNARCDINILNETFELNWKREQLAYNHCKVSIFNDVTKEWISREDYGEGSDEKSASSDSFKRACVNFGLGVELYTAPEILVWESKYMSENKGKYSVKEKFKVSDFEVKDGKIVKLVIEDSKGNIVFMHSEAKETKVNTKVYKKEKTNKTKENSSNDLRVKSITYIKNNTTKEPQKSWLAKKLVDFGVAEVEELGVMQLKAICSAIHKKISKAS